MKQDLKPGDWVVWSHMGHELVTHHHEHHDSSGRPLRHDRRPETRERHCYEKLLVVRELDPALGTVRVQHPDGSESERHPDLLTLS